MIFLPERYSIFFSAKKLDTLCMKHSTFIRTHLFDLDWNRHVTSRTYERFSQEGRQAILTANGIPIQKCMEEGLTLIPEFTQVRFLAQQFAGSNLRIDTNATSYKEGRILWEHKIWGEDDKLACELIHITRFENKEGKLFSIAQEQGVIPARESVREFTGSSKRLIHDYSIHFCDMNYLRMYSPDVVWKAFEEGRWLFFGEIIDTTRISGLDTTCFFMGGKIHFNRLPLAGEKTKLYTWVESVEKIRFYIRQDLIGEKGDMIASMRDEQLFVSISASRPRKAPADFLEIVKDYVELS